MISREYILEISKQNHYRPEIFEKVYYLLDILQQILKIDFLKNRLVLKGGTALNIFCFEEIPRLSVDIDLNYIGSLDRDIMIKEREEINYIVFKIFQQNNYELYRNPSHHAGGKSVWRYSNAFGTKGNLELDINYLYRQPILPITYLKPSKLFALDFECPTLDIHELTAGKLSALFSRNASRDVFDSYYLMKQYDFNYTLLRLCFIIYLAMTDNDIVKIKPETIVVDPNDIKNRLLPVLSQEKLPKKMKDIESWSNTILEDLRENVSKLIPLKEHEIEFIKKIRNDHIIKTDLITQDKQISENIKNHPAILWALKKSKIGSV